MRSSPRTLSHVSSGLFAALALSLLTLATACGREAPPQAPQQSALRHPHLRAPHATVGLIHGMGGWKQILGLAYFWGVPELWTDAGARVYVAQTTSLAPIGQRAAELKAELDQVDGPPILVAHSQGGLDARYLTTKLGCAPRVEALITIAAPHLGTPLADVLLGYVPGPVDQAAEALLHVVGWSLQEAYEMSVQNMIAFNAQVPDDPAVVYWSYAGVAAPFGWGGKGFLDAVLTPSWLLLDSLGYDSDGIVPEPNAHWGTFQGTVPASHTWARSASRSASPPTSITRPSTAAC